MIHELPHAPMWLRVLVDVAACWRLTRLVTVDTFPPILWARSRVVARWTSIVPIYERRWKPLPTLDAPADEQGHPLLLDEIVSEPELVVIGHQDKPGWLAELVQCPHCASVWVAAGIVAAETVAAGLWPYAAYTLGLSAVAGFIVGAE